MASREEFEDYSRLRLYPPITNPNWLVLRSRRRIFNEWLREMPSGLQVLDIGGALQPYRALLNEPIYTAIDLVPSPLVDQIASADALPFSDDTFDLIICTQVLEYVLDPKSIFAEIGRVLKPNGRLLASAPSIFPIWAESDRWRFSYEMLCDLTSEFASAEIVAEIGTVGTVLRTVGVWMETNLPLKRLWRYSAFPVLNALGVLFEPTRKPLFTANYSVLAIKAAA